MRVRLLLDIEVEDERVVDYLRRKVRSDTSVDTDEGPLQLPDFITDCLISAIAPRRPDDRNLIADDIYYAFFEENWLTPSICVTVTDA